MEKTKKVVFLESAYSLLLYIMMDDNFEEDSIFVYHGKSINEVFEHSKVNVETIYSIRVSYDTPTIMNENKIAYMESNKFSMLLDHEKNTLCDGYIDESINDATGNYYKRGTSDS